MPLTPMQTASDLLERAEALAERAGKPDLTEWSVESDMLRAAWTFVGGAIDTYFHNRVRNEILAKPMSRSARNYEITLGSVEDLVATFLANRQSSRPRVQLGKIMHEALLKDTFQGVANIEKACGLVGLRDYWGAASTSLEESIPEIKKRLNSQYHRRNAITHEGDYVRQSRPRQVLYTVIDRQAVDDEISWTRRFLAAIDSV